MSISPTHSLDRPADPPSSSDRSLPKLCGADFELGNFISGLCLPGGTGCTASQLLLREIAGVPACTAAATNNSICEAPAASSVAGNSEPVSSPAAPPFTSQDFGRKFLRNGGCAYIDSHHIELALPEVRSARDHVAYTHAFYRLAQQATIAANRRLPDAHKLVVLAENSDGRGQSYGSHLNVLISRGLWEKVCRVRTLHQEYLAAYQVSSIVFTGLGKVGAENGAPQVGYQLSQRADHIETMCSVETQKRRPIINSRDEPLCGGYEFSEVGTVDLSIHGRLHCITYDSNLCETASYIKIGVLQLILAMMERNWINANLVLEDPVGAMRRFSHDPMLRHRERLLCSGEEISAVDLQRRFFDDASHFVASGACEAIVPEAAQILRLWGDTLEKLAARDWSQLRKRLDWVLKLSLLAQGLQQRPSLSWASPEIKHLDHLYANLDASAGLYWAYEKRGVVERIVDDAEISRCSHEPPDNSRAWTRARLLDIATPDQVDQIDWDFVRFKLTDPASPSVTRYFRVNLSNPLKGTEADSAPLLAPTATLREALTALGAEESASLSGSYGSAVSPVSWASSVPSPWIYAPVSSSNGAGPVFSNQQATTNQGD